VIAEHVQRAADARDAAVVARREALQRRRRPLRAGRRARALRRAAGRRLMTWRSAQSARRVARIAPGTATRRSPSPR
jgi:DNA-binding IclR family transcriptional regulator